ncbi:hypothetical protein G6F56_006732 [Rhizopus delemar]|nr:hypothetical protein G6F56_006732 [Rhizopus delemar]
MMTTRFYYEDGQGKLVDEEGNDAIDWAEKATPFHLRTLTRIYRVLPKPQLDERHKVDLLEFYDNWPQAQVLDAMESLTQKFSDLTVKKSTVHNFLKDECNLSVKKLTCLPVARNNSDKIQARKDWVIKWTSTDMNYLENCVFVDESAFDINMRPSGWSVKGMPAITTTPTTRTVSHTVLGAISTKFVVAMELRNPQEERSKRIKIVRSGQTSYYVRFLENRMDEMDLYPELKGHYIVMDNAPIHTADRIDEMITERGYRSIYLPPYSPELNPIENFWSIVKNKVKRSSFKDAEDLATRIAEACNNVPPEHLNAFAQHSVNCFDICLRGDSL